MKRLCIIIAVEVLLAIPAFAETVFVRDLDGNQEMYIITRQGNNFQVLGPNGERSFGQETNRHNAWMMDLDGNYRTIYRDGASGEEGEKD